MSTGNGNGDMSMISMILRFMDRYGFAAAAYIGIAYFANKAVEYERSRMEPTIQKSGEAMNENARAIERNTEVLRKLPAALSSELSKPVEHKADKDQKHDP